jgi:hypothetical protein
MDMNELFADGASLLSSGGAALCRLEATCPRWRQVLRADPAHTLKVRCFSCRGACESKVKLM